MNPPNPSEPEQKELTPAQIENWRKAMIPLLGPYALIMPKQSILRLRAKLQQNLGGQ